MMMKVTFIIFAILFLVIVDSSPAKAIASQSKHAISTSDIYTTIAKELLYRNEQLQHLYSENKVKRALNTLSTAQSAWQSMDSATHSLKNTFSIKSKTSLSKRYQTFMKKKSRNTKEAAKLLEYMTIVERGLQHCEILQAVMLTTTRNSNKTKKTKKNTRSRQQQVMLASAGLKEIDSFVISIHKKKKVDKRSNSNDMNVLSCRVTLLVPTDEAIAEEYGVAANTADGSVNVPLPGPKRFAKDEVIVCITDDYDGDSIGASTDSANILGKYTKGNNDREYRCEVAPIAKMMRLLSDEPDTWKVSPHPSISLEEREDFENMGTERNQETKKVLEVQPTLLKLAVETCERLAPSLFNLSYQPVLTKKSIDIDAGSTNETTSSTQKEVSGIRFRQLKLRFVGHSIGGAVASLSAMILDGLLDPSSVPTLQNKNHSSIYFASIAGSMQSLPVVSGFRQRVKCMTFGSPPCISRSMVPAYISSLICGDDIMTRLKVSSLKSLESRITEALESGAGMRGLSWVTAPGLITKVAGKNVKKYKGRKQEAAGLHVPGRAFYIKSRKLKQGATLQRILRGNWQEEVLWNIHDVVVTKKMVDHHTLNAYIRTLNRC